MGPTATRLGGVQLHIGLSSPDGETKGKSSVRGHTAKPVAGQGFKPKRSGSRADSPDLSSHYPRIHKQISLVSFNNGI